MHRSKCYNGSYGVSISRKDAIELVLLCISGTSKSPRQDHLILKSTKLPCLFYLCENWYTGLVILAAWETFSAMVHSNVPRRRACVFCEKNACFQWSTLSLLFACTSVFGRLSAVLIAWSLVYFPLCAVGVDGYLMLFGYKLRISVRCNSVVMVQLVTHDRIKNTAGQ